MLVLVRFAGQNRISTKLVGSQLRFWRMAAQDQASYRLLSAPKAFQAGYRQTCGSSHILRLCWTVCSLSHPAVDTHRSW